MKKRLVSRRSRAVKRSSKRSSNRRRRLMPAAAGAIVGYVGYRAYKTMKAYNAAKARAEAIKNRRTVQNKLDLSTNIIKIPAGLTIGKYTKDTLNDKVKAVLEPPIMYRKTHAYRVNGDSGRMNWFQIPVNAGGLVQQMLLKLKDATSDGTSGNPNMADPVATAGVVDGPQEMYKMMIKYSSSQFQLINSSTNSLKGVIQWYAPRRELPSLFGGTTCPTNPINIFAAALNNSIPAVNSYSSALFTQGIANPVVGTNPVTGYNVPSANVTLDYNRAGNSGTNNNTGDNVLEIDLNIKPTSATVREQFNYYYRLVKSTDFDLSPGQQTEFWHKMYDKILYERQAQEFDKIPGLTYFCVIGFQGQIVGTNATTGDTNVVTTGSAQLSIIETHKAIVKPHQVRAAKVYNIGEVDGDTGILQQISDAQQEIVNDETDGIDPTYGEAS